GQRIDVAAASWRTFGKIRRTQQVRVVGDVGDDFTAVPHVVAGRDGVDARLVELAADLVGDAEAGGGVLAVDDDEIEGELSPEPRDVLGDDGAAGPADDVAA